MLQLSSAIDFTEYLLSESEIYDCPHCVTCKGRKKSVHRLAFVANAKVSAKNSVKMHIFACFLVTLTNCMFSFCLTNPLTDTISMWWKC